MTMGYRYNDGFNSNGIWEGEVCKAVQCNAMHPCGQVKIGRQSKLFPPSSPPSRLNHWMFTRGWLCKYFPNRC